MFPGTDDYRATPSNLGAQGEGTCFLLCLPKNLSYVVGDGPLPSVGLALRSSRPRGNNGHLCPAIIFGNKNKACRSPAFPNGEWAAYATKKNIQVAAPGN